MNATSHDQEGKRMPWKYCETLVTDLLVAHGADVKESEILTDHACWASAILRGSHGIGRIPALLKRLDKGVIRSPTELSFAHRSPAIAHLDGGNGFGQFVSYRAMEYALQLAGDFGIGAVSVTRSNWNGCGAYYVNMAARQGMIGLCASNAFPKVAAHGGSAPILGTNPLAFGAPRDNNEPVLIDMATSGTSGATIRNYVDSNIDIPDNLASTNRGDLNADPVLLPYGGAKGFALAIMVEVLSSVISGAGITSEVSSMHKDFVNTGNNGHFFLAVNVTSLMPLTSFFQRMEQLINALQQPDENIRIPGEIRWQEFNKSRQQGIFIDDKTLASLKNLAMRQKLSVDPFQERG